MQMRRSYFYLTAKRRTAVFFVNISAADHELFLLEENRLAVGLLPSFKV